MAVLGCYVDESFETGGGAYTLACYVGNVAMWDGAFTPAWKRVLDEAPHRISEFKASDCRQGTGEFRGWSPEERKQLMERLVTVITEKTPEDGLLGYGAVTVFPGYTTPEHYKAADRAGFEMSLMNLVGTVIKVGQPVLGPGDKLQIVFDNRPKFKQLTVEHFDRVVNFLGKAAAAVVESPDFKHSHEVHPLQAADLIAHETWKEAKSRSEGGKRPVSMALRRLVAGRQHFALVSEYEQLLEVQRKYRQGLDYRQDRLRPKFLFQTGTPWRSESDWPSRSAPTIP